MSYRLGPDNGVCWPCVIVLVVALSVVAFGGWSAYTEGKAARAALAKVQP